MRLNSICSFNCFYFYYIYICFTLATRSRDNYDNNKDTLSLLPVSAVARAFLHTSNEKDQATDTHTHTHTRRGTGGRTHAAASSHPWSPSLLLFFLLPASVRCQIRSKLHNKLLLVNAGESRQLVGGNGCEWVDGPWPGAGVTQRVSGAENKVIQRLPLPSARASEKRAKVCQLCG